MTDFNTVIWNTGDIISQQKMMNMVNNNLSNQEHPNRRIHVAEKMIWQGGIDNVGDGEGTFEIRLNNIVVATESFGGTYPDVTGLQGDYERISIGGSADLLQFRNIDVSSYSGFNTLTINFLDPSDTSIYPYEETIDTNFYIDDWTTFITIFGSFRSYFQSYLSDPDEWKGSVDDLEIWTHGKLWNDFV